MDNNKTLTIGLFPEEIWTEIIRHMPAKQRNPIRTACRLLKDCCYRRSVQEIEKLHLPGVSHMQDIVATLLTSKRSIMNLKFSNQEFNGADLPLWIECGDKIQHLELENCYITLRSIQEILSRCSNLSYLALRNMRIIENRPYSYPLNPQTYSIFHNCAVSETFISLSSNKVIAGSVKTLILKTEEHVSRKALVSLLYVFPNLANFELYCEHLPLWYDEEGPYADRDYHLKSYSCREFAEYLATNLLWLENMKVHIPTNCKCDKFVQETPFFRLKTAEFYCAGRRDENVTCSYYPKIYSFTPSTSLKDLTSIEMSDNASTGDITQALQELKSLREIKMKLSNVKDVHELFQIYEALANSKLNSVM